jgi:hypothetical protein
MRGEPILECDWKLFSKELREIALERHCERTLIEIDRVRSDVAKTHHQRYLELWRLLERRDKEIVDAFNNSRRSAALFQMAHIRHMKLWQEEEFSRFSEETRRAVDFLARGTD